MANNNVKSNVVNIGLQPDLIISLDKYVRDKLTIPISVFKASSTKSAIESALVYLNQKQEGVVEIPATDTQSWVRIVATKNSVGETVINFVTTKHRSPTTESRPYTDDPWQVGDIILNNDITSTKCLGWGCITSGTPGTWEQFGHLKRWYSQIEQVDSLPDPSELQANRQVVYLDPESNDPDIYYCALVPSTNQWTWLKMTIFEEDIAAKIRELYDAELKSYVTTAVEQEISDYFQENPIDASAAVKAYFEQNPINVQNEVETYLGSNPITNTVNMTLTAAGWSGSAAPYQQLLTNDAFNLASDGIANLSSLCSDAQYNAAANARMIISAQSGNSITISAYGTKPTVDIPITIILINSRNNS